MDGPRLRSWEPFIMGLRGDDTLATMQPFPPLAVLFPQSWGPSIMGPRLRGDDTLAMGPRLRGHDTADSGNDTADGNGFAMTSHLRPRNNVALIITLLLPNKKTKPLVRFTRGFVVGNQAWR